MKVLLSWLREFAPIEGDAAFLADTLSSLGLAVEDVVELGGGLEGIIVAEVLALRPHPDADKIQLVDVDTGDGEALQICCGAFNMAVGDRVPLATLGTTMPNGLEIQRRKLRGQWSNGMLCSATELQLGDDHAGILILGSRSGSGADGPELGTPIRDALGIEHDVLFDLDVTGNRPDALSVAGVARDLAARLGVPFALPDPQPVESGASAIGRVAVDIVDRDLCGRFVGRVIENIRIEPSPEWLQRRLLALGMRPINNVVDASNYVMLELGQPSHTFDVHKLQGATLRIRRARQGERIVTLDGNERMLLAADGVLCDLEDVAVGIAGVMGGASTEVDETTTAIFLELAWWDPLSIARTSRRLSLRSEASMRFERGTDPTMPERAARRLAELLAPSGATLAPGVVVAEGNAPSPITVRVRTERVNALLGTTLTPDDISGAIAPIGFGCTRVGDDHDVTIPTWRPDSKVEVDVIEEVARHIGFDRIGKTLPRSPQTGRLDPHQQDRRTIRRVLTGLGIDEAMPVPFLAPDDHVRAGVTHRAVSVTNPLVAEESVMRASLRPGLLKAVAFNESHRSAAVSLFEVGHVYRHPDTPQRLPDEREHLAVALAGRAAPEAVQVWIALADALRLPAWTLTAEESAGLHPTRTARIDVDGTAVGWVGEIDPGVAEAFAVAERVAWLEVDVDAVLACPHGGRTYRKISRFPSSDIDLAFVVEDSTPAAALETTLRVAAGELLVDLRLFDVYRGTGVAEGSRSLAYRLRLQAIDRTLTDDEIAAVRQACIAAVERGLPASLRG
jgi:phenylalanyl-tRNA synthetase beta chain